MLAIAKTRPEPGIDVISMDVPQVKPDEVLIQVAAAAICGGDIKIYRWDPVGMKSWARLKTFTFPRVLGHELSGTIVGVGPNVVGLASGDRVTAESHVPCGQCEFCRTGRPNLCAADRVVGMALNGGFAEFVALPASVVVKVPATLSFEEATLMEPMGVALHAVEASGLTVGDRVVVLGGGPVGLYAALLARAGGASSVVVSDVSPYRVGLAERLSFNVVLNSGDDVAAATAILHWMDGKRAHVVFDAAGAASTVSQALQIVATSGRVVLIGTFRGQSTADTSAHIVHREVTLTGISGRRIFGTWERGFDIVSSGLVDPAAVVTHRFPFSEAAAAFQLAAKGETGKVLLLPPKK
jgi:threonine 3-dehydrogenase